MFSCEIHDFFRSSHWRCFMKKAVLKNFAILAGKLQSCNFIKKKLQQRCFPLNFAKTFKNNYFGEDMLTAASDF